MSMPVYELLKNEWVIAFFVNSILIAFAQRLPLLTTNGWVHAGALGTILLGTLGWNGWFVVVIYLILGSFVTKLGFAQKQKAGIAEARGGRRGPENVWGSAAIGALLAICVKAELAPEGLLLIGFAASFAAKLADTFGSEIGKRWGRRTYLITTLAPVSAGTDGAISLLGTIASAAGSLLMTAVMVSFSIIPLGLLSLIVVLTGFLATLVESLIGALVQDKISWLSNELVNGIQTMVAAVMAMFFASFFIF